MTVSISIPLVSMSMSEATLVEWLAIDGSVVKAGDSIYSIETEKTVMEIEAPASGTLRHKANAGITYPVGAVIGEIF